MADILVRHLKKRGGEHSALQMLVNQWGFDEQLIPKALQTVGSLFPHYSRHDESHSKQILINIERLLGENIELLTATDTWLLLEAAYWHDIGMIVPQSDMENAVRDENFKYYVESIRNSPSHNLHEFCSSFDISDMSRCFSGASTPIQAVDKLRQLMAEWFRRQHPHRANLIVQSPWASAGISSPRTELIPDRLFKILGRICQMHGSKFTEILGAHGLPFREAGLAQEDCHPRFIACLLRMGDLLDLDDNRFCPVMQRISGENRPKLTLAHEDKHSAIRHLRIDREYIEIDAECDTIDGYVEAFKWFDWLKQEMQDQMANWQRIVPNRELGLLPTLGRISVRLSGNLQILSEGHRPQFTLDSERAKELLQGSNIYTDQYACVRELLQNAVDATLLRLWLSEERKSTSPEWQSPTSSSAKRTLENSRVRVEFIEEQTSSASETSSWTLTITDEGTGISKEDLVHMLKIGGSQGNAERQNRISSMPEWMKPSGVFGIGFQSAFLLSEVVNITTKSIFTSEVLKIVMHSPTSDKEGLVLLEQLKGDIFHPYGTKVSFAIRLSKDRLPYAPSSKENAISQRIAWDFDPLLDEPIAMDAANLADKIFQFSKNSPIKVDGRMKTADGRHDIIIETHDVDEENSLGHWRFLILNNYQLRVRYKPTQYLMHDDNYQNFYYRGQEFSHHIYLPHIDFELDLLSGKAGNWLNASRDALAGKAGKDFRELVFLALETVVSEDVDNPKCEWMSDEYRPIFSLFLHTMARYRKGIWDSLAKKLALDWCDLPAPDGANKLRTYLERHELSLRVISHRALSFDEAKFDLVLDSYVAELFLNRWRALPGKTVSAIDPAEKTGITDLYGDAFILKSEPQPTYTEAALARRLVGLTKRTYYNSRYILPSGNGQWDKLFLRPDADIQAIRIFDYGLSADGCLILPFLYRTIGHEENLAAVEVVSMDSFCRYVQGLLINKMEVEEIKNTYKSLIDYIDNQVMSIESYKDMWVERRVFSPAEK